MSKKAKRAAPPRWTPFAEQPVTAQMAAHLGSCRVFVNSCYEVILREAPPGHWLSIRRRDGAAAHDWRELQRVKNEIVGSEIEAVEIYPAESRLVDMSNRYHLWCLPAGRQFPFGLPRRAVSEETVGGEAQRPFSADSRPGDIIVGVAAKMRAFHAAPRQVDTADGRSRLR